VLKLVSIAIGLLFKRNADIDFSHSEPLGGKSSVLCLYISLLMTVIINAAAVRINELRYNRTEM